MGEWFVFDHSGDQAPKANSTGENAVDELLLGFSNFPRNFDRSIGLEAG
jgi:hypothetical protein